MEKLFFMSRATRRREGGACRTRAKIAGARCSFFCGAVRRSGIAAVGSGEKREGARMRPDVVLFSGGAVALRPTRKTGGAMHAGTALFALGCMGHGAVVRHDGKSFFAGRGAKGAETKDVRGERALKKAGAEDMPGEEKAGAKKRPEGAGERLRAEDQPFRALRKPSAERSMTASSTANDRRM